MSKTGKLQAAKPIDADTVSHQSMSQSPSTNVDTDFIDITNDAISPTKRNDSAILSRTLLRELKALMEETARRPVVDEGGGPIKAFDWVTQKPDLVYFPVCPSTALSELA